MLLLREVFLCVLPLSSTTSWTRNYDDRLRLSEYSDAIMKKKKKGLAASLLPPKVVSVLFLFYWKNFNCFLFSYLSQQDKGLFKGAGKLS